MKYILTLLLFVTLCSCKKEKITVDEPSKEDTIVVKEDETSEFGNYYSKAIAYSLKINDSLTNTHIVARQKPDGLLMLGIGLSHWQPNKNTTLYRNRLIETKKLLKEIDNDFEMDSINRIGIGFLIKTGDLAVAVSKQYFEKYGNPGDMYWYNMNHEKHERIYNLIDNSQVSDDIDMLLAPYGKKTGKPDLEKIIFEPKETVKMYNNLETPDSDIPERILDCRIDFEVIDK